MELPTAFRIRSWQSADAGAILAPPMPAPDLYDPAVQEDPFPHYARMRASEPVFQEPRYGAYVLTRFADVHAALKDPATFKSGAGPAPMPGTAMGAAAGGGGTPALPASDPPLHDQLRALVNRAFTPRRVAQSAPRVEALARELVAALPAGAEFDLVPALSIPLPVVVIAEMLGVPPERQDDFRRWSDAFVGLLENPPTPELQGSALELVTYFRELADERRRDPQDDLVSALVQAEIDGRKLTQAELDGFFIVLLVAGNETTTNLISNQLRLLSERPDLWKALREDRQRIPAAIEETVRWDGPVQNLGREATRDVTVSGTRIPEASRVVVSFGAAGRDPEAFEDAEAYRLDRGNLQHLGFGHGVHFCLGAGPRAARGAPCARGAARPLRDDRAGGGGPAAPALDRDPRLRAAAARRTLTRLQQEGARRLARGSRGPTPDGTPAGGRPSVRSRRAHRTLPFQR